MASYYAEVCERVEALLSRYTNRDTLHATASSTLRVAGLPAPSASSETARTRAISASRDREDRLELERQLQVIRAREAQREIDRNRPAILRIELEAVRDHGRHGSPPISFNDSFGDYRRTITSASNISGPFPHGGESSTSVNREQVRSSQTTSANSSFGTDRRPITLPQQAPVHTQNITSTVELRGFQTGVVSNHYNLARQRDGITQSCFQRRERLELASDRIIMELDNDDPRTAAIRRILEDLRGEYYDLIHHCVDLAENLNVQAEDAKVISQMMAKAVDLITHQEDRIYGLEAFAEESQTMATLQADLHAEQHERRALADRIANLQAVDGSRVDSNGLRLLPAEMEIVKATEAKLDGAVTENRALHAALAEKVKMIEDLEKKLQDKNDSGDYEYKTKECRAMVHQWEQTVETLFNGWVNAMVVCEEKIAAIKKPTKVINLIDTDPDEKNKKVDTLESPASSAIRAANISKLGICAIKELIPILDEKTREIHKLLESIGPVAANQSDVANLRTEVERLQKNQAKLKQHFEVFTVQHAKGECLGSEEVQSHIRQSGLHKTSPHRVYVQPVYYQKQAANKHDT